jgi:hypothetical protein
MNQGIIGWIFAVLILFACLAVIAVAAIFGLSMNGDLTNARADLASANDTITQKSADLDKANKSVTKLNGQLQDSLDQATQLQSSMDDLTAAKKDIETKYNAMICKKTAAINYNTHQTAMDSILSYARGEGYTIDIADVKIIPDVIGYDSLWVVQMTADKTATSSIFMEFFLFPSKKATLFGPKGCWVEVPKN